MNQSEFNDDKYSRKITFIAYFYSEDFTSEIFAGKGIKMKRIISVLLAIMMLVSFIAACSKATGDEDDPDQAQIITHQPEYTAFPDLSNTIPNIDNLVLLGDVLYFTSAENTPDETFFIGTTLYSINLDGTNLTQLPGYSEVYNPPSDALGGESVIFSMCVDTSGNIWVAEAVYYYVFELSADMNMEDSPKSQIWDKRMSVGSDYTVRKLDSTGSEILTVELDISEAMRDFYYINGVSCDSYGNVIIASVMGISVFDQDGNNLFDLAFSGHFRRLIPMSDGTTAVPNMGEMLHTIDFENKTWGKTISLPSNAFNIFAGNDDFDIVFNDGEKLYGLNVQTGDVEEVLNFLDNGIIPGIINNLLFLPDGRIMMTNKPILHMSDTKLHVFAVKSPEQLENQEIIELTFAVNRPENDIKSAVMEFNSKSLTHRIVLVDYYNNNSDWFEVVDKLAMDILTGNAPDIIYVPLIPYEQWSNRGLFVDLYPYIDADPELQRSDFFESIFKAAEVSGGLYTACPNFAISTIAGVPSVLGEEMGWTWDEFMTVINNNPKASSPIAYGEYEKTTALWSWLQNTIGEYVDWVSGTAHFDRGDFAELLELCKRPAISYGNDYVPIRDRVAKGEHIMHEISMYTFMSYHYMRYDLNEEIVFKGYPTENGAGHYARAGALGVSITSTCKDIDGAWEFVRTFLTEDWQQNRPGNHFMFPTNKNVFNEMLKEAMTPPEEEQWVTPYLGEPYLSNAALTQDEADQIVAMINSISGFVGLMPPVLENIILEGAADYFAGQITIEDAVRIIQNRTSIFIAEQS